MIGEIGAVGNGACRLERAIVARGHMARRETFADAALAAPGRAIYLKGRGGKESILDWGIYSGSIGPRLRLLRNMLLTASIEVSAPFGLPTGSLTVMALIAANPDSSQVMLARQAGMTGPSLVGLIDELEARGLVTRIRSVTDRRRNRLVLTEGGAATMDRLFAVVRDIEAPIREAFSDEELADFVSYLDRAIAALTEVKPAG
jgi:DNA-binding MarR family transcriptional regulator